MKILILLLAVIAVIQITHCASLRRKPKIYNALITTDQNITPSRVYPVIQPHLQETYTYPSYRSYAPFGLYNGGSGFQYGSPAASPIASYNSFHNFPRLNHGIVAGRNYFPRDEITTLPPIPLNDFGPPGLVPVNSYGYQQSPINLAPYPYSSYPLIYDHFGGYGTGPYLPPFSFYPSELDGSGNKVDNGKGEGVMKDDDGNSNDDDGNSNDDNTSGESDDSSNGSSGGSSGNGGGSSESGVGSRGNDGGSSGSGGKSSRSNGESSRSNGGPSGSGGGSSGSSGGSSGSGGGSSGSSGGSSGSNGGSSGNNGGSSRSGGGSSRSNGGSSRNSGGSSGSNGENTSGRNNSNSNSSTTSGNSKTSRSRNLNKPEYPQQQLINENIKNFANKDPSIPDVPPPPLPSGANAVDN